MTTAILDKFRTERDELIERADSLVESDDFDPNGEEYLAIRSRIDELGGKLSELQAWQARKADADKLDAQLSRSRQITDVREREQRQPSSAGELYMRALSAERYNGYGRSQPVDVPLLTRALTSGDFDLPPTRREAAEPLLRRPLLDALGSIPVTTGSVDVLSYEWDNQADVVPEGQTKPESDLTETLTNVPLDTVAHFISYSRQLAADSGAIARKIDTGLRRGVLEKLEAEASAKILAATYPTIESDDALSFARVAMGELQDAGYSPDVWLVHPRDWAALDLGIQSARADGGSGVVQVSYWDLQLIPFRGIAQGHSIVADTGRAFEVYRRSDVQVFTTDRPRRDVHGEHAHDSGGGSPGHGGRERCRRDGAGAGA